MPESLRSWNNTDNKQAILGFVAAVTDGTHRDYVPPEERIAVFDNDGTLWCEKPMYIQLDYILRKMVSQAEQDPALREKLPWKAAWEKDYQWLGEVMTKHYQGDDADLQVLLGGILSLAEGVPALQVEAEARAFVEGQRHPTLGLFYRECIYDPMRELLHFLESSGFTNYIVSGGGRDFMRGSSQLLYGVPRQRVIGSTVAYRYEDSPEGGTILQRAKLDVIDDGPGKPVQIWNVIGQRPILAVGNSNGDLPMLAFAGGDGRPALRLLLLHDDADREFAYTAGAEQALDTAREKGWTIVSMRDDFRRVFPG